MLNLILLQVNTFSKGTDMFFDQMIDLMTYLGPVLFFLIILVEFFSKGKRKPDYFIVDYKSETSGEIESIEAKRYKVELVDNANGSYSGFLSSGSYKGGDSVVKIWGRNGEKLLIEEKHLFSILEVRIDPETKKSTQTEINYNYA